MQSGQLPVRYEIENTGTPSAGSDLFATCQTVISDGGEPKKAPTFTSSTGTEFTLSSTFKPVASFRMDPNNNRAIIEPQSFKVVSTSGTQAMIFQLIKNATLTTPSWSSVGQFSQVDTASTSYSGGDILQNLILDVGGNTTVASSDFQSSDFYAGRFIDGTSETLTLVGRTLSGTSKILTSHFYKELI